MANFLFALQAYVASVARAGAPEAPSSVDVPRLSRQRVGSPRLSQNPVIEGPAPASANAHHNDQAKLNLRR
jgi:hypothetical protein